MFQVIKLAADNITLAQGLFILFRKVFDDEIISVSNLPDIEYLRSLLAKDTFHIFVAMIDNQVMGGITAFEFEMYLSKTKEMYLYDLAVDDTYRRIGVAAALIEALKKFAIESSVSTIFVEAQEEDAGAIEFYKSVGGEMEIVHHFNLNTRQ